jgi:CRISPR-associated endonuclease Cas1
MGRVQVTLDAACVLLDRNVPLVMTSRHGRICGLLLGPQSAHVAVRQGQYKLAAASASRLAFAKDLVCAKASNSQVVLRRYRYNHPSDRIKACESEIQQLGSQVDRQSDMDTLRGLEDMIARHYFEGLVFVFRSLNIGFSGRVRRPPTDPVNAVL